MFHQGPVYTAPLSRRRARAAILRLLGLLIRTYVRSENSLRMSTYVLDGYEANAILNPTLQYWLEQN